LEPMPHAIFPGSRHSLGERSDEAMVSAVFRRF
jgi:hypothetical protein